MQPKLSALRVRAYFRDMSLEPMKQNVIDTGYHKEKIRPFDATSFELFLNFANFITNHKAYSKIL